MGMMQVGDVLDLWAKWSFGYSGGQVNVIGRLMDGIEPQPLRISAIPYGVDKEGVFCAIDAAICALPPMQRQVILLEYVQHGTQEQKARRCSPKICVRTYRSQLKRAEVQIGRLPCVQKLLDNVAV